MILLQAQPDSCPDDKDCSQETQGWGRRPPDDALYDEGEDHLQIRHVRRPPSFLPLQALRQ